MSDTHFFQTTFIQHIKFLPVTGNGLQAIEKNDHFSDLRDIIIVIFYEAIAPVGVPDHKFGPQSKCHFFGRYCNNYCRTLTVEKNYYKRGNIGRRKKQRKIRSTAKCVVREQNTRPAVVTHAFVVLSGPGRDRVFWESWHPFREKAYWVTGKFIGNVVAQRAIDKDNFLVPATGNRN